MSCKIMYAFRGWIAFVAFMDLGTTVRSYIEKRSFLSNFTSDSNFVDEEYTTSRILGMFSVLKAIVLIHCTLYIHYKPVVSLGAFSILLSVLLYLSETLYFRAATLSFYVTFPCILNIVTLCGLMYLPAHLKIWELPSEIDENLKNNVNSFKKKRRKNN
ncbi:uncharacterized protein LOC108732646 [Agrilus planipennis]|uniref:Uncharacterized protein LOC108732646 n=1 Tax=Agrilus planipennis TaxID=224129 RepID=A0A1W4W4I5_AGRPL|nr:uncharacterized protein LOC108732646 [Agrilus planipennis]